MGLYRSPIVKGDVRMPDGESRPKGKPTQSPPPRPPQPQRINVIPASRPPLPKPRGR